MTNVRQNDDDELENEDSYYNASDEEDDDDDDDCYIDDSEQDECVDFSVVFPPETFCPVDTNVGAMTTNTPTTAADFRYEFHEDSDVLHTPPESEDEELGHNYPTFKMSDGSIGVQFHKGLTFNNKQQAKEAIKEYAMETMKNIYIKKNEKEFLVAKCDHSGCPFHLRISKRVGNEFWQIVSFIDEHACHRTPRNRQAKTNYLAKKFVSTLRHTPEMKVKGLIALAIEKWGVKLSHDQAYRAKLKAIEIIQGAGRDQFIYLRSYADELRESNRNSTVIIQCDMANVGPIFQRIYVCLEACKAAFAFTCRPLIGLDACFLKGEHGGQLMAAVGQDGNNQMFPIAYAVVEAETKESWQWFLNLLLEDLNNVQPSQYAFISDQQKGLVPAIQNLGNHVEQRLCVKHLRDNWSKKYPGMELKEVFWMAARATTVPAWERAMNRLKAMNEKAWKDMKGVPPAMWTRSHFKLDTQSDLQVNNMCEAFNRSILEYRDKPIITLLEGIKHYITKRIGTQKDLMQRYRGNICPIIQEKLELTKRVADRWQPTWHHDDDFAIFGVTNGTETYIVNLIQKTCTCRKWDLTGIPCCHAIACIWHNKKEPEDYVSSYYRKSTFMATYSHIILPTNGPQLWRISRTAAINPPVVRRAIGRPKKNRNKANDEKKNPPHVLPSDLKTKTCKKCHLMGHNKRTCGGKRAADRLIPKGGNKKANKSDTQGTNCASGSGAGGSSAGGFGVQGSDGAATILTQGSQPPPTQDSQT
ncbi:unnamed protein product [Trifolium pratense]|uniref:Uncharacterized protein n=1 Tax=Trifolium pratense TaxID=57577 RepID=A0ACB0I9U2_TRIPR|nr:unnamed protein product [Trifolium pratense]